MIDSTSKTFEEDVLKKEGMVLVDFWAPWCAPCRMVGPIVEEISEEYGDKVLVAKVNVDNNQDLAAKYGVQSIPTILLFKDGKQVDSVIGARPKSDYDNLIKKHK